MEPGLCITSNHLLIQLSLLSRTSFLIRKFRFREIEWPKITHLVNEQGRNVGTALSDSTIYLPSFTSKGHLIKIESQAPPLPPEWKSIGIGPRNLHFKLVYIPVRVKAGVLLLSEDLERYKGHY